MAQYALLRFASESEFLEHAIDDFKALSQKAILKRGKFSVALSGGNTPKVLFEALAKTEIDWSKIHFYWGDERYVPYADPASNFGMAQKILFSHINIPAANIHPIPVGSQDPHEAARKYEDLIKNLQFDLIYLGIGLDGHTASLFPGILLPTNTKVSALYVHKLASYRISLMPDCINSAREIRFLVSGSGKQAILDYITQVPEPPTRYPCQLIKDCTIFAYGV